MNTIINKNMKTFQSIKEFNKYLLDNGIFHFAQVGNYRRSYIDCNTYTDGQYMYDLYVTSGWYWGERKILIKHKKLKIYQSEGGRYVLSYGNRCWVNSFFRNDKIRTVKEILNEERN